MVRLCECVLARIETLDILFRILFRTVIMWFFLVKVGCISKLHSWLLDFEASIIFGFRSFIYFWISKLQLFLDVEASFITFGFRSFIHKFCPWVFQCQHVYMYIYTCLRVLTLVYPSFYSLPVPSSSSRPSLYSHQIKTKIEKKKERREKRENVHGQDTLINSQNTPTRSPQHLIHPGYFTVSLTNTIAVTRYKDDSLLPVTSLSGGWHFQTRPIHAQKIYGSC